MKKILKYLGIGFLGLIVLGAIGSMLGEDTEQQTTEQVADKTTENKVEDTAKDTEKTVENAKDTEKLTDEQKAKIVEYFKSDKEPSIVDALFPYDTLKLGVHAVFTKLEAKCNRCKTINYLSVENAPSADHEFQKQKKITHGTQKKINHTRQTPNNL